MISAGSSAIQTGISLFSCGPVGWIAGTICLAVGVATVAFGANEVVSGLTGVNMIREATGMSQELYEGIYLGLNIASTVCTIGGQAIRGWKGCRCFIAGTLVLCMDEDGNQCHKPIEDVKVGDMVWAYDEETGENDWKPVVRLFRNQTKEWYHIFVNGEEIVCTGGHPFYVVGEGFVEAKDLKTSDKLLLSSGKCVTIEEIQVEQLSEPETTYNFEVADFHTYYVSKSNVLVHNKCKISELDKSKIDQTGIENVNSKYGTYDVTYSDGSHYVGKGGKGRMWRSAADHATNTRSVVSVKWKAASSNRMAFMREALWMRNYKAYDITLLNKIASPGFKMAGWIWRP